MAKTNLTAERLRTVLSYDENTGVFVWKISAGRVKHGTIAGKSAKCCHARVHIDGNDYWAHRLAWLYVYGAWPANEIDHINGVRSDNRIANLRDVSRSMNQQNQRRPQSDNKTSSYLGVSWRTRSSRWRATITIGGKQKDIGLFDTEEAAHEAYKAQKRILHAGCTI